MDTNSHSIRFFVTFYVNYFRNISIEWQQNIYSICFNMTESPTKKKIVDGDFYQ